MTPQLSYDLVIDPTMRLVLPAYDSPAARVMLVAIGCQESGFKTRVQAGQGPARGFWQFERNGGCVEVEDARQLEPFRALIRDLGFDTGRTETWTSLGRGADHLGCIMARAVLWLDPEPLPQVGDRAAAWLLYLRRWRPGKPHRMRWIESYTRAMEIVGRVTVTPPTG